MVGVGGESETDSTAGHLRRTQPSTAANSSDCKLTANCRVLPKEDLRSEQARANPEQLKPTMNNPSTPTEISSFTASR